MDVQTSPYPLIEMREVDYMIADAIIARAGMSRSDACGDLLGLCPQGTLRTRNDDESDDTLS